MLVTIKQNASKQVEWDVVNTQFDYTGAATWKTELATLGAKLAQTKTELLEAFNHVAHLASFEALTMTKVADQQKALTEARDLIEEVLGKAYAKAFAMGIKELEFKLPEQAVFEALDFSAFVGAKTTRTKKEAEHGIAAMIKTFRNKVEKLQKTENPQPWVKEEIDAYALIIKTLEDSASKE